MPPGVMAVYGDGELTLHRRIGKCWVFWRVVRGGPEQLARAHASALELDREASALGGWANALGLGLHPAKPVHDARISTRILIKDDLNGRLGKP